MFVKYFYKNIILFYKITKVETYNGIFYERNNVVEDLKLDYTKEDIYYMNNREKIISKINIMLGNGIHKQKRIYIYCYFEFISFLLFPVINLMIFFVLMTKFHKFSPKFNPILSFILIIAIF